MKRIMVLSSLLVLIVAFGLASTAAASSSAPIVLKYSDPSKEGTSRTEAAKETFLEIEKRTNGRVKHEYFWSESLVKAKDSLDAVKAGTCDVGGAPDVVYNPGRFPIWQFSQLLFLGGPDVVALMKAWNEMAMTQPQLKEEYDKQGVKFLANFGYPTTFLTKKPLAELADFKGQKIRAVAATGKWISSLGATSIPMTFYEVTEGLARGVIDGTMGYLYVHVPYKFYDFCKYFTITPISNTLILNTWMNKEVWNKLPPDIQKIYEEAWLEFYPKAVQKHNDAEVSKYLKIMQDAGVKTIELTPAQYGQWKNSATFLVDDYVSKMSKMGVDGKKIIEQFEALYKKYEKK